MPLTVWHASHATEPVRFAASELGGYLGRITDQDVLVSPASGITWPHLQLQVTSGDAPTPETMASAHLATQIQPVPAAFATSPGADAFVWQTGGGVATIVGSNPRSILFGVYDLLEEWGCRFFSPDADDEIVTRRDENPLDQPRERFEQATFVYRERHFLEWIDEDLTRREIDHAAKRRMNGFVFHIEDFARDPVIWQIVLQDLVPEIARRGLLPGIGEHGGYPLFLPPELYAADHPDWYAQVDGRRVPGFRANGERYQFCTEHPGARATFLSNLETFLRQNPLIRILHLAPEDAGRWCECTLCSPTPVAERYLRLDNAIAELAHHNRAELSVTHLVYANHAELPAKARPKPGLKVSFVPFGRDFSQPITDPRANMRQGAHPWSLDLIEDWARLCQTSGAGFIEHTKGFRQRWITFRMLPLPHLQADLRWWRGIGAHGFNAPQEGEGWWTKHLNAYVFARLMWNLDEPVDEMLRDYFERYWAGISDDARDVYRQVSEALPNLSYARNQPAHLPNRALGLRLPPAANWAPDAAYLERAMARLVDVARRVVTLRDTAHLEPAVEQRIGKLADSVEGALASLDVSLRIRQFLLARGGPGADAAAAEARAAHARFVDIQTPRRLREGTLWTGQWRRDEALAELERQPTAAA
jgi:uncharacterized protein DUF4838